MGLMNGRWDNTVHVLHMYAITERCDCLNIRQAPMLRRDLGFLVGRNPFAIDRLGAQLLAECLDEKTRRANENLLRTAETSAAYAAETYGIPSATPVERIAV